MQSRCTIRVQTARNLEIQLHTVNRLSVQITEKGKTQQDRMNHDLVNPELVRDVTDLIRTTLRVLHLLLGEVLLLNENKQSTGGALITHDNSYI